MMQAIQNGNDIKMKRTNKMVRGFSYRHYIKASDYHVL